MPDEQPLPSEPETQHFIPRRNELDALAKKLPINGVEFGNNRVFNIWGETGVGKSSFISEFRESKRMSKEKVLWIQPTRDGPLDDIPEFIRACASTIRYPASPNKEKKISEQFESVQRGKVNPIVSDDSILITRSSIASQKKPYINQAAASSVGRTEIVRDDVEINVGLGESKASNHAEGFLDAIPLKALGTDLTIIFIEHYDRLSITIMDWLRDYVFPAATRGAYRRSLIFLLESTDPLEYAYPNETWGEWSNLTEDIRLYPLSKDDSYKTAISLGAPPSSAQYLQHCSLGYPGDIYSASQTIKTLETRGAIQFLDSLAEADQIKVAALSLPQTAHVEDIATLFGSEAKSIFEWVSKLPTKLATPSANGKALNLSESLRCEAISRAQDKPAFQDYAQAWRPMGRIIRNIPSRNDRAKLFLLSGLLWMDSQLCTALFKDQANKILPFITESNQLFNRVQERYCISERFRKDLRKVAIRLKHPGVGVVLQKATKLWDQQRTELEVKVAEIEEKVESTQVHIDELARKQSELNAQIRIHERATGHSNPEPQTKSVFSKFLHLGKEEDDPNSPETLRNFVKRLASEMHQMEQGIDSLNLELKNARDALRHPYVEVSSS